MPGQRLQQDSFSDKLPDRRRWYWIVLVVIILITIIILAWLLRGSVISIFLSVSRVAWNGVIAFASLLKSLIITIYRSYPWVFWNSIVIIVYLTLAKGSIYLLGRRGNNPRHWFNILKRYENTGLFWSLVPVIATTTWILSIIRIIQPFWSDIIYALFVALGFGIAVIGFLFSLRSSHSSSSRLLAGSFSTPSTSLVMEEVSTAQLVPSQSPSPGKTAYVNIMGQPPPTDAKTIQQRKKVVEEVYTELIAPNTTAVALTGMGGAGKSTLAALVSNYVEDTHRADNGPFAVETIWLTINASTSMADLAGTVFEAFGKSLPDLQSQTPQSLALSLFNVINTTGKARLIVLDQFEWLLDEQTGHALADRPGVSEWIDVLNRQKFKGSGCRVLLTSRTCPKGTYEYLSTDMQEYRVEGLEVIEGVELLRSQGVKGTDKDLHNAVKLCEGHALALTLLVSLLGVHRLSLTDLLENPIYVQLWQGDIASNLLDYIYTKQLSEVQRKLLLAFSVYREAVLIEAALASMEGGTAVPMREILTALNGLIAQHLLQPTGEGCYQLHAIVASYAQSHFDENNQQASQPALQAAHAKAAQYYLQQTVPPRGQRLHMSDVKFLIEAIWHKCQAGLWQEAYILMEQEDPYSDLKRWGRIAILLELYQLLLPLDKWQADPIQSVSVNSYLASTYNSLGQKEKALQYYLQALEVSKTLGDRSTEGRALNDLSAVYNDLGRKEEALQCCQQALEISRAIKNQDLEGVALNNLGRTYSALGKKEEALDYYQQALKINESLLDRIGEARTLNNLGNVYNSMGKKEEALDYYQRALEISKNAGDRIIEATALNNLGGIHSVLGTVGERRQR